MKMKQDLKSFIKDIMSNAPSTPNIPGANPQTVNDIENMINRYSDKSSEELMNELLRFKNSGMMSNEALQNMAQTVAPMLDAEQQQRLYSIIQYLGQ